LDLAVLTPYPVAEKSLTQLAPLALGAMEDYREALQQADPGRYNKLTDPTPLAMGTAGGRFFPPSTLTIAKAVLDLERELSSPIERR
jgi:hypothetical protein